MKQTVIWLALALVFAIGATLSVIADSFGPTATAETAAPATLVEAPQPVVAASAKPAEPLVPVVLLDDVPPKSAASPEALARWFVAPGAPPAAETLLTPLPLAPARTIAGPPGQDSRTEIKPAEIKPLEADARPTRKPQNSNAQMPAKRRTANARACGSSSRWTDLLRRLNLASRCPTRRSAA
jgi:hypothetical protein